MHWLSDMFQCRRFRGCTGPGGGGLVLQTTAKWF